MYDVCESNERNNELHYFCSNNIIIVVAIDDPGESNAIQKFKVFNKLQCIKIMWIV